MGYPTYLTWKHRGDNSMLGKRGTSKDMADGLLCKTRTLWQRLDCLNVSPDEVS